jgi:hypothetical protein
MHKVKDAMTDNDKNAARTRGTEGPHESYRSSNPTTSDNGPNQYQSSGMHQSSGMNPSSGVNQSSGMNPSSGVGSNNPFGAGARSGGDESGNYRSSRPYG